MLELRHAVKCMSGRSLSGAESPGTKTLSRVYRRHMVARQIALHILRFALLLASVPLATAQGRITRVQPSPGLQNSAGGASLSESPLLSVGQMRADLAFLREKIKAQDANPWLYTSQDDFDRLFEKLNMDIDRPLSRMEFYRRAAPLAASLKDGHTLVDPLIDDFQAYAKTGGVFPMEVTFLNGRLYVASNATGDDRLSPGVEIVSINGRQVSAIVRDYRGLINDVHPIYDVYARLFREMYWLQYGEPKVFVITYRKNNGIPRTVTVSPHVYPEDAFHSYQPGGSSYDFKILPSGIGLLTINSFAPSEDFSPFLDRTFDALQQSGTNALIIDIRKNGGGSGRLAQETVSYLTDQPYKGIGAFYVKVTDDLKALYQRGDTHTDEDTKRIVMNNPSGSLVDGLKDSGPIVITPPHRDHVFHGKVYLLTANNTFSAAAMFAAYVKCNNLGTVVGQEPGQSTNFVADAVPFIMPNSGLSFDVSFSDIHMPCEQSYYHGIRPDYPVVPSPQSITRSQDVVLDYTLRLISQTTRQRR